MSRRVVYWLVVALLLVATVVVSVAVSGGEEREVGGAASTAPGRTEPASATSASDEASDPGEPARQLVLVRRRAGLPPSWIARLRRHDDTEALALVSRTQWLLRRSTTRGGKAVSTPPDGYAIPLDTFVVDPPAYARVTEEPAFRQLGSGRVLLSQASAELRDLTTGDRITLTGGRVMRIAGVIPDGLARNAEIIASAADVPRADRRQTQAIVATTDPQALADAVPEDRLTRVALLDTTAPAQPTQGGIVRPLEVKRRFGEFAVRLPYGQDWIDIDPAWRARNIVSRQVPILGTVTCHRDLIAPLRRALGRLQRRGLARLVDPGDYAGCYAPRRIPGSGSLSLHAWGLAVDINASENPQGAEPTMDRRIVAAFEDAGFTWGGRWPTAPDGMHFELHGAG